MQNRFVIPIHNAKGELVAYAGRSIDGAEPRYKFPAGFHKSLELFNLHRVNGDVTVVLVEGFFDCMKVTQAGYPCVALMGSTMSKAQEELLAEHFAHVVVMLDGDEAGKSCVEGDRGQTPACGVPSRGSNASRRHAAGPACSRRNYGDSDSCGMITGSTRLL